MSSKRIPVPISFMVVVAALIALFIFFGAWAVSVDADNQERNLTFAIARGDSSVMVNPSDSSGATSQTTPSQGTYSGSAADTWWGKSLTLACPLH